MLRGALTHRGARIIHSMEDPDLYDPKLLEVDELMLTEPGEPPNIDECPQSIITRARRKDPVQFNELLSTVNPPAPLPDNDAPVSFSFNAKDNLDDERKQRE